MSAPRFGRSLLATTMAETAAHFKLDGPINVSTQILLYNLTYKAGCRTHEVLELVPVACFGSIDIIPRHINALCTCPLGIVVTVVDCADFLLSLNGVAEPSV